MRGMPFIISSVLLLVSAYFFFQVELFKQNVAPKAADKFKIGGGITIVHIVDGDDVTVENSVGQRTVVRILGIKSFDPFSNDPVTVGAAKATYDYLKNSYLKKQVELVVGDTSKTKDNRLLAYIHTGKNNDLTKMDIGLDLISKGLSFVYTQFKFARQDVYLDAQLQAQKNGRGLWGNESVKARVMDLQTSWQQKKQAP